MSKAMTCNSLGMKTFYNSEEEIKYFMIDDYLMTTAGVKRVAIL